MEPLDFDKIRGIDSPESNIIEFKPKPTGPTLEIVNRRFDSCRHELVLLDEETRGVECKSCKTKLDAFDTLMAFARKERNWIIDRDEWRARQESLLSTRYDAEWERRQQDVTQPPSDDPEMLRAWNTFREYFQGSFCGMYKRKHRLTKGPLWYGKNTSGGMVSYAFARDQLVKSTGKQGGPDGR